MYDSKAVRRRRAVLLALVVSSLILLTAYFGESSSGGLHAVQRGVGDVISPIQEGASRALKPGRDLVGWVGDTFDAKSENEDLRKERDRLRRQVAEGQNAVRENKKLRALAGLQGSASLADFGPVTARVIGKSPSLFFARVRINKGTSDGIREDMPVVGTDGEGSGLVGRISDASGGNATITLITDASMAVPARTALRDVNGVVAPKVGNPRDLVLQYTQRNDVVNRGDVVVTAGTTDERFPSLFPSGVPIGRVTRVDEPRTDAQEVHLEPDVDLRRLEFVQVLTKVDGGPAA